MATATTFESACERIKAHGDNNDFEFHRTVEPDPVPPLPPRQHDNPPYTWVLIHAIPVDNGVDMVEVEYQYA